MNNPVIIFGAGTLGKIALDIFNENEVLIYGILDDKKELHGQELGNIMILGSTDDDNFLNLVGKQTESFIALPNKEERKKMAELLQKSNKAVPVNAIHKSAVVSEEAELGHGNLIAAISVVGPFSKIGNLNIIGSGSILEAGCDLGNYIEIGSGSVINADVVIEDGAFIGSNVTLVSGITIGKNARVGAGSVVIADVKAKETVFGNPASSIEK